LNESPAALTPCFPPRDNGMMEGGLNRQEMEKRYREIGSGPLRY
jgi:hypothetical protein